MDFNSHYPNLFMQILCGRWKNVQCASKASAMQQKTSCQRISFAATTSCNKNITIGLTDYSLFTQWPRFRAKHFHKFTAQYD